MELFLYFIRMKEDNNEHAQFSKIDDEVFDMIMASDRLSVLLDNKYKSELYSLLKDYIVNEKQIGSVLFVKLLIYIDTFYEFEEILFPNHLRADYLDLSDYDINPILQENKMIQSITNIFNGSITLSDYMLKYPEGKFCFSQKFIDKYSITYSPLHILIVSFTINIPSNDTSNDTSNNPFYDNIIAISRMISIDPQILTLKVKLLSTHGNKLPPTTPLEFAIYIYHEQLCQKKQLLARLFYNLILALIEIGANINISKQLIKTIIKNDREFNERNLLQIFVKMGSMRANTYYKKFDYVYCVHCGCDESSYICSGCNTIKYCSPECQTNNWKWHKKCCKKLNPLSL